MGSILKKFANWFFSALGTLILIILAYLGWYKYLMAGLLFIISAVMAFLSIHLMRDRVIPSNPFEPPLTRRKRTANSIIMLLAAVFLFTVAILSLTGFINY